MKKVKNKKRKRKRLKKQKKRKEQKKYKKTQPSWLSNPRGIHTLHHVHLQSKNKAHRNET